MGWRYRLWQFGERLRASVCGVDERPAAAVLSPSALRLFRRMSPGDRQHALQVLERLRAEGQWPNSVEQAALLHDVGKSGARLTLVHRAVVVLLPRLSPRALERLAGAGTPSWRHPLYVQLHHAELGAALCAEAGCPPETVALVRSHQSDECVALEPEWRAAGAALHRADERS